MSAVASPEEVAAKLREMGMAPAKAASVARGELEVDRTRLSLEHRAKISARKASRSVGRVEAQPDRRAALPEVQDRFAPPVPAALCPRFGIVPRPGRGGISVARLSFLDGPVAGGAAHG